MVCLALLAVPVPVLGYLLVEITMSEKKTADDCGPSLASQFTFTSALEEIARLRGDVRWLRSILRDAMEWDGQDRDGVDAIWLEAAKDCMKGTSDGR